MDVIAPFEVYAIRYAHNGEQRASANFLGGDPHDVAMPLDYFIWVLRRADRCFIVDTGFDPATAVRRGRQHLGDIAAPLAGLGIAAADIRDVLITHLHYDHCGNHDLFPGARFHLQDREMAFATGRCMCHPVLRHALEEEDVVAMVRRVFQDRVRFHQGVSTVTPGVELHHVGGHTDGLQVVRVWTRRGWMVLASDASHLYANMEGGRPFPVVRDVLDMLEGHRTCYALADRAENVIPGHDPLVTRRYPPVSPRFGDRLIRLDADPR